METSGINYVSQFLEESKEIISLLNNQDIEDVVQVIVGVKASAGRLFFAGSGGGAGHSSHAVCDFRKLADIESYSVTDNVSELTARINDESWETSYANWLRGSKIGPKDCLFVFSVGGGDEEANVSRNLVNAINYSKQQGAQVVGIVGRDGGHLRKTANASILIPNPIQKNATTQTEGFQALIWHLVVCHPDLGSNPTKWETVSI